MVRRISIEVGSSSVGQQRLYPGFEKVRSAKCERLPHETLRQ
jgi:hypothetical protein